LRYPATNAVDPHGEDLKTVISLIFSSSYFNTILGFPIFDTNLSHDELPFS